MPHPDPAQQQHSLTFRPSQEMKDSQLRIRRRNLALFREYLEGESLANLALRYKTSHDQARRAVLKIGRQLYYRTLDKTDLPAQPETKVLEFQNHGLFWLKKLNAAPAAEMEKP